MQRKQQILQEMGVAIWRDRRAVPLSASAQSQKFLPQKAELATMSWQELETKALACTLCALHKTRTHVVFGVGNRQAEIMFIGEAPGANEDLQGEPFVGRAGMLLNEMLRAIGLKREDIYIANILKCRPPNNRDPLPEEVKLCTPYLEQQIALIKPKVLVAVGRIAAQFLLNTTEAMSKLRGQVFQYGKQQTPLLVTYHPAYLLRSPREKSKAYADFLAIQDMLKRLRKN